MEKLQCLLSAERQKEFQSHVVGQEKETEIQHLRQQMSRLEADRLTLSEQLRTLRSEVKLKGEEIQRLKSELASERFQREHAKQQLASERAYLTSTAKSVATAPPETETIIPPSPPSVPRTSSTSSGVTPSTTKKQENGEKDGGEEKAADIFSQERESVASDSARTLSFYSL